MKGSALVLLGCLVGLFAAPIHSYSISEDDQLANRRDAQSGSPSTDAATSEDAGERKTIKTDGDANPGNESVAGDAQTEHSKIRKRDTSLSWEGMGTDETAIGKEFALELLKQLGKYGGKCFEQLFNYFGAHEMPVGVVEPSYPEGSITRSNMVEWLDIVKDSVPECLKTSLDQLNSEHLGRDNMPDSVRSRSNSGTFDNVAKFLSPLTDIRKLEKCLQDAITYLESTSHGPGDTLQRSHKPSLLYLFAEMIEILSAIDGKYLPAEDIINSIVPWFTGVRGEAVQIPHTSGMTTHPEDVNALPIKQSSLLDIVLNEIYSKLQQKESPAISMDAAPVDGLRVDVNALPTMQSSLLDIVLNEIYSKLEQQASPAVNMEAAPVEGLRVDANGALRLHRGNGESPAMGNPGLNPECVDRRVQ